MQINVPRAVGEDDIKDMRGCLSLQLSFHTSVSNGGGVNGSGDPPPTVPSFNLRRRWLCKKPHIINYPARIVVCLSEQSRYQNERTLLSPSIN
jgi:hypothetical protein